ncbi:MAG: FlgD immunoglobulin-like domain containing protein [bacterium]
MTRHLHAIRLTLLVLGLATLGQAQYVEDSIDVGGSWVGSMAYNSREDVVYGVCNTSDFVFAIDCRTNSVVSRISVDYPKYMAYDSLDNKLYCTFGYERESVLVVDGFTHQRLRAIPMRGANIPGWDRIYNRVYVSCEAQWDVKVIDCRTDSVIATIRTGDGPLKMHINPRRRKLYVQNHDEGTIAVVDMTRNEVVRSIRVRQCTQSGAYDTCSDTYWVGLPDRAMVIDCATESVIAEIPTGIDRNVLSVAANGAGRVMLGVTGANVLLTYDSYTRALLASVPIGSVPRSVVWNAGRSMLYVANSMSNCVSAVSGDGSMLLASLPVQNCPSAMAYSVTTRRVYVGHSNTRLVYVLRDEADALPRRSPVGDTAAASARLLSTPFSGVASIAIEGRVTEGGELQVFTSAGNCIRQLLPASVEPGCSVWRWDGRDAQGRAAPAGVYLFAPAGSRSAAVRGVKLR